MQRSWRLLVIGVLSAQVQDNFSDGDFTQNPTWTGTDAYWQVTPDYRLRSNGPAATATLYLSTPNTMIAQTEWRFWVRVAFNPSTQNFVRIYLVADRSDLTDPGLNGYYLRLGGITGTADSLELWRQQGATHTRLAGGRPGRFGGTDNVLWIRILRDASGGWQAFTDSLGFWEPEFAVTDAVLTTTNYFGLYFQHTSSNRQNFWIDDIYVGPPIIDTTPPQLLSADILSPTLVRLTFSEAVTAASATTPANYTLSPGPIPIGSITQPLPSQVELTLGQPLQPSQVYTLTYANIQDMAGNTGSGQTSLVLPEAPLVGDLVISEVMAKPTPVVGLPPYEYVELHNASAKWLQLSGCRFCDATQCATLPALIVAPGEYILLVPSAGASSYPNSTSLSPWPTLNDSGDSLTLWNSANARLDLVLYTSAWYRDPLKAQGGWSLEKIDLGNLCAQDSNWIASLHPAGGTPGAANSVAGSWQDISPPSLVSVSFPSAQEIVLLFSEAIDTLAMQNLSRYSLPGGPPVIGALCPSPTQVYLLLNAPLQPSTPYQLTIQARDCPGNEGTIQYAFGLPEAPLYRDVLITEIMADPTPVVGLPPYEYIEIHNRSPRYLSLEGWNLRIGTSTRTLPPYLLLPGSYVVLTSTSAAQDLAPYGSVIALSSFPAVPNTGSTISLSTANGLLLDEVSYTDQWYRDPAKKDGGWSLERIDLEDFCATDSNWIASQAPLGGTPGQPNSVYGTWRDQTPPALRSVTFRSPTEISLLFSEPIDTTAMRNSNRYTLSGGSILAVQVWSAEEVSLSLSSPLLHSTDYELQIQARDCRGNEGLIRYPFGLPEPAAPYEVILSEIMADPDPAVGLPPYEYVEIHNRSAKYVQLQGWTLQVGNSRRTLPAYLLRPGHYLTLSSVEGAAALSGYGPSLGLSSFPAVSNTGTTVSLRDSSGRTIDEVSYTDSWYGEASKKDGGWSLERIWVDWACGGAEGWRASASPLGGTPGQANSLHSSAPPPPPSIRSAAYLSPVFLLRFSERMDTTTLREVSHYTLSPSVSIVAATPTENGFAVELFPLAPPEENRTYHLCVSGLLSCAGETRDSLCTDILIPAPVEPGDILLNEILPEPQTGGARYVELYNPSDKLIDISTLLLARGASPYSHRIVASTPVILPPGGYLCLTADTADVQRRYLPPPSAHFHQMASFPAYDYSRDTVWLLRRTDSVAIDRVPYASTYHFPDLRSRRGVSLERLSPRLPSTDPQNWYSAASTVRYGTPGYPNSQREDPSAHSGIHIEPYTFSPDGDGYDDLLWIYLQAEQPDTRADISAHTLSGHEVCRIAEAALLAVGENRFRWEGTDQEGRRLPAGLYILHIRLTEPTRGEVRRYRFPCAIAEKIR